jgi:putative flippase GtrA
VDLSISSLRERARTPTGQKAIRYTLVSVVAVVVSQISLAILYGGFHWTARSANITASIIGGVPSYYLNRTWAWGKTGKSHIWREVVPFWVLAFLGLAFSTWTADAADSFAKDHIQNHLLNTATVMGGAMFAYGVLWVGKFILFNKVIFVHHPKDLEDDPALDGRTGIPT